MVLDKRPGVRLVRIRETLRRTLAKLVTRADGDQEKTARGNMQLCTGLEAGIEDATHAVGKRILERARQRRSEEEARKTDKDEEKDKSAGEEWLKVETKGTERRRQR